MKKYEYKTITQGNGYNGMLEETDDHFLKRINELGAQGFRFIGESIYDCVSNSSRVVMEKEIELSRKEYLKELLDSK